MIHGRPRLAPSRPSAGRASDAPPRPEALAGLGPTPAGRRDTGHAIVNLPRAVELASRQARVDVRRLTPRQMTALSMDLYLAGRLSFEECRLLAFQPDLQPEFARTIGALTGRPASPDRPRDHVAEWRQRLEFARRWTPEQTERIERTRRIVDVLVALADDSGPSH